MFTADFSQAKAYLARLQARLANPQPVLAMIGRAAMLRAQREIETGKHDPEGHPWAPWSDDTANARRRRGNAARGILYDEGTLLHSMSVQVGAASVVIGTEVPYAEYLQDGTRRMPARPFLGWGEGAEQEAEHTMIEYLEAAL